MSDTILVLRSYRYRLSPTRAQSRTLDNWLILTRELYNAALQERRDAWEKQRIRVSMYDQMAQLPAVRGARPEFAAIPIVVLRGVLRRLDRAFAGFFRRVKARQTPGYPRFRGRGRFESLLLDDIHNYRFLVCGGKRVAIPLLGKVKVGLYRPLGGSPKTMLLKREVGRWSVTFACVDVPAKPLPKTGRTVGIDLGLHHFLATSDGDCIPNERPGGNASLRLARAQRRASRRRKGGTRKQESLRLLARAHARVANQRRERHITVARALVAQYDTIVVENLNVKGLARGMLAKQVNDAGWASFLWWLHVKAEEAGRAVISVNPSGTSQSCSACGLVVQKTLAERTHRCPCGYVADRDVNAARNILALGMSARGAAPPVRGRQRSAKSKSVGPEHTA